MRTLVVLTTVAVMMGSSDAGAGSGSGDQWNQFRGPGGSGIAADDIPLPAKFDQSTNMRWSCDLPPGHSSPCIWEDRIFLTAATDLELQTICIDRTSGDILWQQKAMADTFESRHRINSAATPTAATDGERVFVYFGSCGLVCYDMEGNEQWLRRMRIPENMYGTAGSPIIAGAYLVFLNDMADGSWLEAIDPETGKTIWRTEREGFSASWSTPVHWKRGEIDELIVYGVGWITAYDLSDGSPRWSVPGVTDEPAITPVIGEGMLFITSYNMNTNPEVIGLPDFAKLLEDYDENDDGELAFAEIRANKSILSRVDANGEGDHPLPGFYRFLDRDRSGTITEAEWKRMYTWLGNFKHKNALIAIKPGDENAEPELVWQHNRGVPECPSPLYHEGRVYMVKNGGMVSCFDARTGEVNYRGRLGSGGPYYASPVVGDGKVFTASAEGVVTVFEAGDELNVLARNDIGERIMATPALVDGTIYVRTEGHLFAFSISPQN